MSEVLEEKWPKGVVASVVFFFVLVLMLATLVPNDLIDKVMTQERQWGNELLTTEDMRLVIQKTDTFYVSLILDSGIKKAVSDLFMPKANASSVESFDESVGWWFQYLAERGVALQKIIYQINYRIVMILYWLPFLIVVLVPAAFAGVMRWKAKQHSFDYASPTINNNALIFLSWGTVLILLTVLVPIPIPPLVICSFIIIALPIVISLLISNLPKRI